MSLVWPYIISYKYFRIKFFEKFFPDIKVRYSNVGKADKCEDLWSGCSEIISQLTDKSQLNGVRVVAYCKTAFKTDGGASCRNLGYPKNQRPF